MQARKIKEGIHWVGAIDWDRQTFDALIPLPDGTSYNSYYVEGSEKNVLIDTVDPEFLEVLLARLYNLGVEKIDYIVANHAEQDHSGSLPWMLDRFPEAKVVCTSMCQKMLIDHLGLDEEQFHIVKNMDTISLGDRTLEFIHFPWIHWPETMITYLKEEKVLFPCDLFGSHLASNRLFSSELPQTLEAARLYYAQIMMPFTAILKKNFKKIEGYEFDMICPSHGPVHDKPGMILKAHEEWISAPPKNKVVLAYISMHESTRMMAEYLVDSLTDQGVEVELFNLETADLGKLASATVDAATIVIGSPGFLGGAHPAVVYAAHLVNLLRPKARFAGIFGSFGWGVKLVEQLTGMLDNLKVELLEPVLAKGAPDETALEQLDKMAEAIAEKHRSIS